MKILTVGDLHGSTAWKEINPHNYDKIIFVGDYVDSFHDTDDKIINNLLDLLEFKNSFLDKVVLLWGNHDVQYLFNTGKFMCSGFRKSYNAVLNKIFTTHYSDFTFSYQISNYLWTHAGISKGWYFEAFVPAIESVMREHYSEVFENNEFIFESISQELNYLFEKQHPCLFNVCHIRGGTFSVGGPLWLHKEHLTKKPLKNMHQIVGHNKVKFIMTITKNAKTSVTYTDCLDRENRFYKLEI